MEEQTIIEKPELQIPTTLKALIEALIFAAQEPLSVGQIRTVYQGESPKNTESRQIEPESIRQIVSDLNKEYEKHLRPYRIVQIAGGYQFATLSSYAEWLGKLYKEQGRRKLSQSGVETLSIIAYKQPIAKADIEKIRGVNCDYVLKTLLEKELLTVTGRAESVGRPLLYGTTKEFLKHFGLNDITDLPRPREIEEILGESQFETERRMLEAQAGAEQAQKEQEDFKSRLPHIPKKKSELDGNEVEIVPRMSTREIRIMPVEDRKTLEEAGQEKIEFTKEESSRVEQSPALISVTDEVKDEAVVITSQKEILPDTIVQESSIIIFKKQADDASIEAAEEIPISVISVEQELPNGEKISAKEEAIHVAGQSGSLAESQKQPKRWSVWKEKIQGFIKKLFA
jgi:segregation and condensation protein B